jgi:hypothetical protein
VYLGRDYPAGYTNFFRPKLKAAFMKKRDLVDESEIRKSIAFGNYIVKGEKLYWLDIHSSGLILTSIFKPELEAMYYLKKYRTLRARYTIPEQEAYMAIQKKLESERL